MPIGVFDSGLGGLTILGALTRALPEQDFVYLGDNANAPYGWKSPAEIYELTIAGVERLFAADCRLVILACNTASAVALHDLQVNWLNPSRHRVLGVFVPVIEHLTRRDWGDNAPPTHTGLRDVALFATPATVRSGRLPARTPLSRPRRGGGAAGLHRSRGGDRGGRSRPRRRRGARARGGSSGAVACAAVGGARLHPLSPRRGGLPRSAAAETALVSQPALVAQSLTDYLRRHPRLRAVVRAG